MKTLFLFISLIILFIFICSRNITDDFKTIRPNSWTEHFASNKLTNYSQSLQLLDLPQYYDSNESLNVYNPKEVESIYVNNNEKMAPASITDSNDKYWSMGKNYDFSDIANDFSMIPDNSLVPELYKKTNGLSSEPPLYSDNIDTKPDSNKQDYKSNSNKIFSDIQFTTGDGNFTPTINDNGDLFNYLGIAYNEYYDQYYLLYEFIDKTKNNVPLYNLYEYLLVKLNKDNTYVIEHRMNPREKINFNDMVYFSYGSFELGPLVIKKYNFNITNS